VSFLRILNLFYCSLHCNVSFCINTFPDPVHIPGHQSESSTLREREVLNVDRGLDHPDRDRQRGGVHRMKGLVISLHIVVPGPGPNHPNHTILIPRPDYMKNQGPKSLITSIQSRQNGPKALKDKAQ